MRINSLVFAAAMLALGVSVVAQNPPKPLSQGQLTKTLDAFGAGDPLTKGPLSIGDTSISIDPKGTDKKKDKTDKDADKKSGDATEITAREASFDQKTRQAVFGGDVVVKNPEFNITCDKLTAFLKSENKPAPGTAGKTPVTPATPAPKAVATPAPAGTPADKKKDNSGGLEKAIAEGNVIIIQEKVDAEGNVNKSIGKSKRALYDSITGDVTLTGHPEVQQGINTCVATDENTVIVLNREGRMKVTGPHKTVIRDAPDNPTSNAR